MARKALGTPLASPSFTGLPNGFMMGYPVMSRPMRDRLRARRAKRQRVSAKISTLRHEGNRPDVAVATALNMERKHRLHKGGRYVHVKRKSRNTRR